MSSSDRNAPGSARAVRQRCQRQLSEHQRCRRFHRHATWRPRQGPHHKPRTTSHDRPAVQTHPPHRPRQISSSAEHLELFKKLIWVRARTHPIELLKTLSSSAESLGPPKNLLWPCASRLELLKILSSSAQPHELPKNLVWPCAQSFELLKLHFDA
jgi:hypothetical protein